MKYESGAREQIVTSLKNLDLSTYEAEVYAVLLAHPALTAGALCKETGISDTKIYYALETLAEKGMITIRNSNPKVYKPVPPKEAIANLKQRLKEKLNQELKQADALVEMLIPIYENAEKPEELEIGYIINGRSNIANRMKTLIGNARKEITFFVSYPELYRELNPALREISEKRRIKLNVAMTEKMLKTENIKGLDDTRQLCCDVTLLIADLKTLITVSDWNFSETAMLSQDQNLIRVAREYYENSMCYIP
jgi:sugar-specific transcriptional regulator TrmB